MSHRWLQDVFDVPLIIMLTDDEKYLFSDKRSIEEVRSYTLSNTKDIIAVGFDPKKTFIFSDYDFMGGAWYRNITRMSKHITLNVARAVFGFHDRYGRLRMYDANMLMLPALTLAKYTLEPSKVQHHLLHHSLTFSETTSLRPISFQH
jgi:tryptophanyl-tRNA synthetase